MWARKPEATYSQRQELWCLSLGVADNWLPACLRVDAGGADAHPRPLWAHANNVPASTTQCSAVLEGCSGLLYYLPPSCSVCQVIIGDKSILMEGCLVETHSVLEPGTVLPPGRLVPAGQLWGGNPAKFMRELTRDEVSDLWLR